jgi:hypothetical protein
MNRPLLWLDYATGANFAAQFEAPIKSDPRRCDIPSVASSPLGVVSDLSIDSFRGFLKHQSLIDWRILH